MWRLSRSRNSSVFFVLGRVERLSDGFYILHAPGELGRVAVLFAQLQIGARGDDRHAHGQRDLEGVEVLFPRQPGHPLELLQVVFHRGDAMADEARDLDGLLAVEPLFHGERTMAYAGADILLLAPRGKHKAALLEGVHVAADRARVAHQDGR
jgi:hypothetical protein